MIRILVSPYASRIPDLPDSKTKINAKNYPYWKELIKKIKRDDIEIIQLGVEGEQELSNITEFKKNLSMKQLKKELDNCDFWISVDNFFHHFAHYYNKPGIVIWGPSNPDLFGYKENLNIFKSKELMTPYEQQYLFWRWIPYQRERFLEPDEVFKQIKDRLMEEKINVSC